MVHRSGRRIHGPRSLAARDHRPSTPVRIASTAGVGRPEGFGSQTRRIPMTANNLTVTTALPPRDREEVVLRVAATYEPSLLRIVASIPMPDFRRPLALYRFLLHRDRTLKRLDAAAALARTLVSPQPKVETELVRGGLSDYLACGVDSSAVMVVPARSSVDQSPVERMPTH